MEIVFVTIAFATGAFIASDSGAALAAGAGADRLGGMRATTILTGGGIHVRRMTKTGNVRYVWRMK
jgi:hypothetical protein